MPCVSVAGAIVCGDFGNRVLRRHVGKCWGKCASETARIVIAHGNPWYPPDGHCVECGDSWALGDCLYSRPFQRGWRPKAIARHEAMWERAKEGPVNRDEDMNPIPD